jgi:uncharacterized membrane protein YcaP (DUF421 family)
MQTLFGIDWQHMLLPSIALAEIILRGSFIYLGIFALMRFVLKREAGTIGLPDLLMTVLIADAAQNAMASEYHSLTEGAVLIATIVFWNYALDWLGHRFPRVERLLHPPPLLLIKDGRLLRRHMRQELVTEEELMSHLRQQGIADLAHVKEAYMEGDGQISIIPREQPTGGDHAKRHAPL